MFIKIG